MKTVDRLRVPPEQLRWTLSPADLGFKTTAEVASGAFVPGQHRAHKALEIGIALRGHGYNVFVAGEPGTNRSETVRYLLNKYEDPGYIPEDFCYVHNFRDPDQPRLLRFTAGQGRRFRDAMTSTVDRLSEGIPRIYQSEVYAKRRKARVQRYSSRMERLAAGIKEQAEPRDLVLVQVEIGDHSEAELFPFLNNEPVAFEDLETMVEEGTVPREEQERLMTARADLDTALKKFREAANAMVKEAESDLAELDRQMTRPYLNVVLSGVYREFQETAGVTEYLRQVESFLESRMAIFRQEEEAAETDDEGEEPDLLLKNLKVNLILDNADTKRRPVVYENNPSATNLRGPVDREMRGNGMVISDFTHIKAGSLIRSHGGFLIIHADDLSGGGRPWGLIKRVLRTQQVQIESPASDHLTPRALRPEPIEVDLKVIVIGTSDLYQALLDSDPDFLKMFKLKAEFDTEMELGSQAITEYACLVRSVTDKEQLPPFTADGVAAVVEFGVRMAGQRNRITTRFTHIADLVREAAFWARSESKRPIAAEDVHRALFERRHRVNLIEEKTQRLIREGVILIETKGDASGQINGLAVLDVGDHRFGRPTRITASVAAGTAGVLNIERMAALSGRHHDKGVLILDGFLMSTFAINRPVAMTASITLEQSYNEVDGDSATSAEIYALISALSGMPARQDLAVTGSMNQKGHIQAVGGVNEKIEGFFDLCSARGLTGEQGVIIPASNIPHLQLRPGVIKAVDERNFHIYAVSHVEEGAELLMGAPSGVRGKNGQFPKTSIFGKVQRRLLELSEASRDFLPWNTSRDS